MQIAYRAKNLADAQNVRDVLLDVQIAAHIADQPPSPPAGGDSRVESVHVMVDNRCLDQARRAIAAWKQTSRSGVDPHAE